MASAIRCSDDVGPQFDDIRMNRLKATFVIHKIDDPSGTIITETLSESESWDDFVESLPTDDCRYALYVMKFQTDEGRDTSKLVWIDWAPDECKARNKMLYAASKEALILQQKVDSNFWLTRR